MTNAPVTPGEAKNLIISPTATFCLAFVKLFLQLPTQFYKILNYLFTASGAINNLFLQQIFNPGDLKFSASALSQTSDWLLCDGSAVSRTTYAGLFAAINTVYGAGDSSTTFNLPDFRGRFPIGLGTTTGLLDRAGAAVAGSTYSLGQKGGEEKVKLIMAELPNHIAPVKATVDGFIISEASTAGSATTLTGGGAAGRRATPAEALDPLGTDTPHNNIPPFQAVNVYIKI
jgi:microcystin-dependent protein